MESYTSCFPTGHVENHHVKTIGNLDFLDSADRDPHHFTYLVGAIQDSPVIL